MLRIATIAVRFARPHCGRYTRSMIRVFRPIPAAQLKLLVFDLDGTLVDSAQDLCNSVNAALIESGLKPLADPVIAGFVGNGAPMLVRRALAAASGATPHPAEPGPVQPAPVEKDLFDSAYAFFLKHYREHKLDFTYAYDGVLDALRALQQLHDAPGATARTMAVLTNKPVRPAQGICEGLGLADYFLHIYGGDSFPAKKPDPMGLQSLMEETGARPEETAMIGDSKVDVATARNAGVWSLGCSFGFGVPTLDENRPDVLVDRASEWPAVLAPA